MTTEELMKELTKEMEANGANIDDISKMEMCVMYLGNEEFRQYVNNYVWNSLNN